MGFYSFYRIIKDVIKSIFGNKAWRFTLLIALIILVITLLPNKVHASDLRPWNVYTNTTEFNWSRLTNMNFAGGSASLPYKMYEIRPEQTYYLYNPNSNNGSIHYYCYSSNDVDRPQVLIEDTSYNASLHLDYNFEFPSGYIDFPYNTLVTPQMTFYVFITDSCELYLLDDKYSNIEAYNELSAIADYLYGTPTPGTGTFTRISNLSLHSSTSSNTFYIANNADNIFYVPIESNRINSINFHVDVSSFPSSVVTIGYCDSVPAEGVSYTYVRHFSGSSSYDLDYNYSGHKYVFVRAYGSSSTCSITSYSVSNVGLDGMNDNATYQGEATRQTLTDSNISQDTSDYAMPTDSTNDITQVGFGSIFDRIRTTFTSGSASPITITIPFTNKSFTISKSSVFGSANLGIVQTIIEAFWFYVVGLYITKDIFKKIEKIKTGNIEFTESTNIKEDIL